MRILLLASLLLLLVPLPPAHGEDPGPAVLEVPVGAFVQLDGRVDAAEWEGALVRELAPDGTTLRLLQRRGTLLLALTSPAPWPPGSGLWLGFRLDEGGDAGLFADGAVRIDFEPREHNRPHLLAFGNVKGREVPLEGRVIARATADAPASGVEMAIELEALDIEDDASPPLRFVLLWTRGPRAPRVVWPPAVSLEGPAGRPPVGLDTSTAWARLGGWREVGKGGAFPRTALEAWRAEDDELARRGKAAHDLALAIFGDQDHPKEDDAILAVVRDNLLWIAEREPLTPYDLLTLAKVYRFLNRTDEALALLRSLDAHPTWRRSASVLYERARTLENADAWEEAAGTWRKLAGISPEGLALRYEKLAERDEERERSLETERAHRAEDAARSDLPLVLLRTTRGDVLIQLFAGDVEKNVAHFLDLVGRREGDGGFYDGTRFHRVVGGYLVQGGDPASREDCAAAGKGKGPTRVEVELNERHGFWRGAVGFARAMVMENGSQFFILTASRPELESQEFTCFGHVVAGMDVVDRLETCDTLIEARILGTMEPPDEPEEN